MAASDDLEGLEAAIKDLENRIRAIGMAITKNEEEMIILASLQVTLKENIIELKNAPIALAHEFRKAKEDLRRTHIRMSFLRMDRTTLDSAFNGQTGILGYLKKEYEDVLNRIQNNVIKGEFGKKNGG